MNRKLLPRRAPAICALATLVAGLVALPAMAAPTGAAPERDLQLAYVTVKSGMDPSNTPEYEDALEAACGELGTVANSKKNNAQVVGGWSQDQYANQVDPDAAPKKYGNHLTVETFVDKKRTGRWHLYKSGSVWVDRKGDGKRSAESCHS